VTRILLVEDEENYRDPLALGLRRDGFEVVEAQDGITAVERFEAAGRADGADPIDLVLLDLMLPRLSGTEVCRRIRRASRVPVIMLTAKDSEVDKVVGLEIGADDYVTKPYSYRELLARVHAVLRRSHEDGPYDRLLSADRVVMDLERHEVRVDGEAVTMPLREFELLELFLRHPDRVLARSQIIEQIWGANYVGDTKTLDVHVKRIRAKIEVEPGAPRLLTTVRGVGYMLVSAGEAREDA
jgi:response regulator